MTKEEPQEFAARMKLLDSSEGERAVSTTERRVRQLDQIWLMAQRTGLPKGRPLDLSAYDQWARIQRILSPELG